MTKLMESCPESGWHGVCSVGRPNTWADAAPSRGGCHLRPRRCSPVKHLGVRWLLPSLCFDLEAHRSFAVNRVLNNYPPLPDQGLTCELVGQRQLWVGLARRHRVPGLCGRGDFAYVCVVALIPCSGRHVNTSSLSSVLSIPDKIRAPPARCSWSAGLGYWHSEASLQ